MLKTTVLSCSHLQIKKGKISILNTCIILNKATINRIQDCGGFLISQQYESHVCVQYSVQQC